MGQDRNLGIRGTEFAQALGATLDAFGFQRSEEEITEPLLRPLFNDLLDCEDLLAKADTQFARRTFFRASFAFIEAQLYWFRTLIAQRIAHDNLLERRADVTTLALLFDAYGRPDKRGRVRLESNRVPFLNRCAFVLRTAAVHAGIDPESFFSDNGWNEIQRALRVRHRITHPQKPEDLDVTDSEVYSLREAHRWFFNRLSDIVNWYSKHKNGH